MRQCATAERRRNIHAQSVIRAKSILQQRFPAELEIRRRLHQLAFDDRDVPLCEVLCGHRQLTRGEQPALPFLRRYAERSERITLVTDRVARLEKFLINVRDTRHTERRE